MCVTGMYLRMPPIADISLECTAWMMQPAQRNSSALNMAWVKEVEHRSHVTQSAFVGIRMRYKRPKATIIKTDLRDRTEREHALDVALYAGYTSLHRAR